MCISTKPCLQPISYVNRMPCNLLKSISRRVHPKGWFKIIKSISQRVHPKGWVKIISAQVDGFIIRDESKEYKPTSGRVHLNGWVKTISSQVYGFIISNESNEDKSTSGGFILTGDQKIMMSIRGWGHPQGVIEKLSSPQLDGPTPGGNITIMKSISK